MHLKNEYRLWILALIAIVSPSLLAQGHGAAVEESDSPQLEIRNYRFSRFTNTTDRLVLEFHRKDNSGKKLKVRAENKGNEWTVDVENAVLLGAIPEVLINDAYRKSARYLGAFSVNMEGPASGFSMKVGTLKDARVVAQWLENPTRLVIDTEAASVASRPHRETMSFERTAPKRPTLDEVMCFPATAKVNLTVSFQPRTSQQEEMQNIRINTNGTTLAAEANPPADAIVCYPKRMAIGAMLSFEERIRNPYLGQKSQSSEIFTPAETPKTAEKTVGHESDLDPLAAADAHLEASLAPTAGHADEHHAENAHRNPAEATAHKEAAHPAPAKHATPSPLSLLPPSAH